MPDTPTTATLINDPSHGTPFPASSWTASRRDARSGHPGTRHPDTGARTPHSFTDQVRADAARERVRQLLMAGMPKADLAGQVGFDGPTLDLLVDTTHPLEWIDADVEARVLTTVLDLDQLPDDATIHNGGTVRRVRALAFQGWSYSDLAEQLGTTTATVRYALDGHTTTAGRARQIRDLYERLNALTGPSQRPRRLAIQRGWASPDQLDASTIDLPDTDLTAGGDGQVDHARVLRFCDGEALTLNVRERRLAVAGLARRGMADSVIAARLGISVRTVLRVRERHDIGPGCIHARQGYGARWGSERSVAAQLEPGEDLVDAQKVRRYCAGEDVALSGRERASAVLSYWLAGWPVGRIARRMGCARSVVLELLSRYAMPGPGWDALGTGCNDDEEVVA